MVNNNYMTSNENLRFSIYVHIPFCIKKCGYCDFNTYAGLDKLQPEYTNAVINEINGWGRRFPGSVVSSIAFGGGTPGEMPAEQLGSIVNAIQVSFVVEQNAEVTLEANPGTTSGAAMKSFVDSGFTRISLGAQSFSDQNLVFLDRIHSSEAIAASLQLAKNAGFRSINLDLIYGLPGQSMDNWREDLRSACKLGPDHLSLYNLTVEEETPLYDRVKRGETIPLSDDVSAEMYEYASSFLSDFGYIQYELSNWSKPGHHSRHNYGYWTWKSYIGVGAGAHGFIDGERIENIAHPREYIHALRNTTNPEAAITKRESPALNVSIADWLTLHLRLIRGFHEDQFYKEFGVEIEIMMGPLLQELCETEIMERFDSNIKLTSRGRLLHSEVAVKFLIYLEDQDLTKYMGEG